jgi:hypothetical protein
MKKIIAIIFVATQLCFVGTVAASAGTTVNNVFSGSVVHISSENLKVYSPTWHQTMSFMIVPKFDRVFSGDGKTTYEMAKIRPGAWVKVYFDQKFLGMRHADRIIVVKPWGRILMKS